MSQAAVTRLQQICRSALARNDVNLAYECAVELRRYGVELPDIFEVERAIPAAPLETAVHRVRTRPRPKAAP